MVTKLNEYTNQNDVRTEVERKSLNVYSAYTERTCETSHSCTLSKS
jgi:hypothetical protein